MTKQPIDPRTTRRTVAIAAWRKNSALYSTYEVVNFDDQNITLQKKLQFCVRNSEKEVVK